MLNRFSQRLARVRFFSRRSVLNRPSPCAEIMSEGCKAISDWDFRQLIRGCALAAASGADSGARLATVVSLQTGRFDCFTAVKSWARGWPEREQGQFLILKLRFSTFWPAISRHNRSSPRRPGDELMDNGASCAHPVPAGRGRTRLGGSDGRDNPANRPPARPKLPTPLVITPRRVGRRLSVSPARCVAGGNVGPGHCRARHPGVMPAAGRHPE